MTLEKIKIILDLVEPLDLHELLGEMCFVTDTGVVTESDIFVDSWLVALIEGTAGAGQMEVCPH